MFAQIAKRVEADHQERQASKDDAAKAAPDATPKADIVGIDPNLVEDLRSATNTARDNAEAIAKEQGAAVDLVESEVATYEKKPPGGVTWQDLALLAVNIATAGVGGALAAWASTGLETVLKNKGVREQLHETLTGVFGEAIQTAFSDTAGAAAKSGVEGAFGDKDEERKPHKFSSNARLDFFAAHKSHLRAAENRYKAILNRQQTILQPLLRTDPTSAVRAMQVMGEGCESKPVLQAAFDKQALATATQWASGVAQGVAGKKERMHLDLSRTTVTDFSKGYGVDADKRFARGLLRLSVRVFGSKVEVLSAAIDGVAQEIADRFSKEPIENLQIPVRVAVTHLPDGLSARSVPMDMTHQVWITRDESGSIRVKGKLGAGKQTDLEAATALCQTLFSKPLTQWGVTSINTDDASGRG